MYTYIYGILIYIFANFNIKQDFKPFTIIIPDIMTAKTFQHVRA